VARVGVLEHGLSQIAAQVNANPKNKLAEALKVILPGLMAPEGTTEDE